MHFRGPSVHLCRRCRHAPSVRAMGLGCFSRCHRKMFQNLHVNSFHSSYRSRDTMKRCVLQAAHLPQRQVSTASSVPKSDARITIQPKHTDETLTIASTEFVESSWLAFTFTWTNQTSTRSWRLPKERSTEHACHACHTINTKKPTFRSFSPHIQLVRRVLTPTRNQPFCKRYEKRKVFTISMGITVAVDVPRFLSTGEALNALSPPPPHVASRRVQATPRVRITTTR